jgi:hypothetical protein
MRAFSRRTVLAAVAVLAGCNMVGSLAPPYYRGSYQPGETGVQGNVPVVVRGSPFAAPDVDVALAVVDAMQGNTWWPTRFTPATVNPQSSYRVVVLFNGPGNMPYPDLCTSSVLPTVPRQANAPVPVSAALCKWDILMAATTSNLAVASPRDPQFRGVMAGMARALFPPENPDAAWRGGQRFF